MPKRSENVLRTLCAVTVAGALLPMAVFTQPAHADVTSGASTSLASVTDLDSLAVTQPAAAQTLTTYFDDRAAQVEGEQPAQESSAVDASKEVLKVNDKRADNLAALAESGNLEIKTVSTDVSIEGVQKQGSSLDVKAYEWTTFTYDDLSNGVGGTDTAAFGTDHTLTLDDQTTGSKIVSDAYDESDLTGIDTTGSKPVITTIKATAVSASASATATSTANYDTAYNPASAILYADTYALSYNSAYKNFNPLGGDCANFTSQSLSAGGLTQRAGSYSSTSAWHYASSGNYTSSWVYCPSMVSYLKKHGRYIKNPTASQIYPGSPVFYMASTRWSHATICVGYNSAGTPIIDAHNNNRYHVPYTYWNTTRCTVQLTSTNTVGKTFYSDASGKAAASLNSLTTSSSTGRFTWMTAGNQSVSLRSYSGTASTATVPSTVVYNGVTYSVKTIGPRAFSGNTYITSVDLGSSVKTLWEKAFYGCKALATVTGGGNVTSIRASAFRNCKTLAKLPTFSLCTSLGKYAFRNCDALTSVAMLPAVKTIGNAAFYGCDALVRVTFTSAALTKISASAFALCSRLAGVTVASRKVTQIGASAFYGDANLTSAIFDSTVLTSIGATAFYRCSKLSALTLSSAKLTRSKIGASSFKKTCSTMKVKVPSSKVKTYRSWLRCRGLSSKASVTRL